MRQRTLFLNYHTSKNQKEKEKTHNTWGTTVA